MVRKIGPRLHQMGSLYPVLTIDIIPEQLISLSPTSGNSSTVPNSPSDSATIVGSPITTRASSPFEPEFSDIKSQPQDYFSEFTTLLSKSSSSTSISSESPDSLISTPDYSSTGSNLSTSHNKCNIPSIGPQKTHRANKRKSSARKLQYDQIITFNDNIKPNDVISEQFTNPEAVSNFKTEYTFVEENINLIDSSIYNMQQTTGGSNNLWGIQTPYFTYDSYNLPNGPLKNGRSGDVFLTDWNEDF